MGLIYSDIIYGQTNITEAVILELIACPSLQRLKNINQYGYYKSNPPQANPSRFEHSMGVYLLLKKYGAPLEEQIAGLIHDVSHAAFSHCVDYVLDAGSQKEQSHQDNIFEDFVRKSEIPEILKKYNFDLDYILDDNNFPLKEKNLPDLCADRLDYSLRDAIILEGMENSQYFLSRLEINNGRWIFKDSASADKYAELFLKLNTNHYSDLSAAAMVMTLGDYLRYALIKGYIVEDDLYTTDDEVLSKVALHMPTDPRLKLLFEKMNKRNNCKNNPDNYDAKVFCKSRMVDPLCRHEGAIKRLSEIKPQWKEIIARESKPKEYYLKFE